MAQPIRFGIAYDFRLPPGSDVPLPDLYAQTLEQIQYVDQLGYDHVWITEHHFVEDGYMPSYVAAAGAIAALTKNVAIGSDVLLMPFQHPVRLAEDLAVLDNLSGGRLMLGVGLGYARHEFAAFGVNRRHRVSLTEEGIEILRLAWSQDEFSFHGKRFHFDDVRVRPRPVQPGGPPIWIAAMSEAGAHRAARFDTHLLPQGDRNAVLDPWRQDLTATGRDPADYRVGIIKPWLLTDDPESIWPQVREAERYRGAVYAEWIDDAADDMTRQLERGRDAGTGIPQTYVLGDAEACVTQIRAFVEEFGVTDLITWGAPPGIPPALMTRSLERFAKEVLPRFR
jgi:alkanesulfonate monooxygenase SsuD/methylene tetrahydromethanopterin reductase-like flavin-dependent oxidoreductase (luciferase family)